MNTLESCEVLSPFNETDTCAKFLIDDITIPFTLHGLMNVGQMYTLNLWVKSNENSEMVILGERITVTEEWLRHTVTFFAEEEHLKLFFETLGIYYIYHPKLEIGNEATDWTEAPEDSDERVEQATEIANDANSTAADTQNRLSIAESKIIQLSDSISTLVRDADGNSLMTQTGDGWTFSMSDTTKTIEEIQSLLSDIQLSLGDTTNAVETLKGSINDVESSLAWVKVDSYNGKPCIALGETGNNFKLIITNTEIMFIDDNNAMPAYISNQTLHITKAVIEEELHQGDFVWKIRDNGNMGLIWKGVVS